MHDLQRCIFVVAVCIKQMEQMEQMEQMKQIEQMK